MQSKPRRNAESNFTTFLKFIADPALIIDGNANILVVNDTLVSLTGLKEKDLVGSSVFDLSILNAENRAIIAENFGARVKGLLVQPYEVTFTDRDGEVRSVEITSKKIGYFEQPAFLVVVHDITQRKVKAKQLEEHSEKMEALVKEKVKEIAESEKKYRELINGMNDTAWVIDLDANFIDVNDAAVRVLGYSREELLSMGPCDIDDSLTKEQVLNLVRNMPSEQVQVFETAHTTKDGRTIPVEISSSLVTYQGKQAILSIARDISERRKTAAELSESENKYRTLVEQSLQGILIAYLSPFRFIFANQPAVKILGYTVDELKSLSTEEIKGLIHPGDIAFVLESFREGLLGTKEPQRFDFRMIKKNGKVCWVETFCTLTANAGEPAVQAIFVDITERKHLENALRASEEMFRAISTSAMDAIILLDDKAKITYWNPAAEKIFGYTHEEAVGKKLDDLVISPQHHGLHSKSAIQTYQRCKSHRKTIEAKALRKNGTEVPIEISVASLEIQDKTHVLGIIRDTTERKKMETTLREAENRYHALFDKAPLGILVVDETATAVEFNEEAHRQLGYTREEFAKLKVYDYEVIETPEEVRGRMKKILREGKDEFETKHRTKNGEIRDVINTVQLIELAGKKFFHLITRDITEQKKIEQALKLERDKLEAATENIGAGLGIISKDYRILWVNRYLEQYNPSCEGKKCFSTFNNLTSICPDCGVRKVFEEGVSLDRHEYAFIGIHGNPMWAELIVTPLKDKDGNIIAALELSVDITEKKLLQKKLREYSDKLEQLVEERTDQLQEAQSKLVKSERLAAIGELAAMVGHDLRNPLTGITGATYYLKNKHKPELGAKAKEMLEIIENSIIYSNKIVDDLLEYSRDLKLELTKTTPKKLLKTALSLTEVPKGIRVVDATEGKPTIKVDAEKLRRVFVNIIRNAFDAMPDDGILTIKSRNVKGKLEISFKDTGTGMSKETLSKLKGGVPLFTTKAKGMGFGVPICKRVVEAHGGELLVESKVGKGTTVTITVPVKPKPVGPVKDLWIFNESMMETVNAKHKTK